MKTKKEYQTPKIEVIKIENENDIMTGSTTYNDTKETGGTARGRRREFWEED